MHSSVRTFVPKAVVEMTKENPRDESVVPSGWGHSVSVAANYMKSSISDEVCSR